MTYSQLKLELFHARKAFSDYHRGWRYLYNRFITSKSILNLKRPLETQITNTDLSIHTMLGHQHVLMTLWALGSFYAVSKFIGQLYLHGDGTLTARDERLLKKCFPSAILVNPHTALRQYADKYDQYPRLRDFRHRYADNFYLTKLIDPYIIPEQPIRLFFDIDILWFKNSALIEQELRAGCPNSLMMGTTPDPDDQPNLVYFKDGTALPSQYLRFNGGIMLYHTDNMPANKLANYLESLDMTREESQHWVEQAGYAYNLQNLKTLPLDTYIIKGPITDKTIAKHYTGPRRVEFYSDGLPRVKQLIWPS